MKKKIISFLIGALVLTSLSTTAFASTNNASKNETIKVGSHMTQEQVEKSKAFLTKHPDLITKYNELKNNSNPLLASLSVASNGSATPLSNYYTYFVASNYDSSTGTISNYEDVRSESTTQHDFNGTIYVGTVEIGYGAEGANFNGTEVSKCDDVPLDFNNDRIVDGFIDVWKIANVTSGKFTSTCSSYSMNRSTGKWPSYTTSINIL